MVLFESTELFSGKITSKEGKSVKLEISFKDGKYRAVFTGSTKLYLLYDLVISVKQGDQERILKFATGK